MEDFNVGDKVMFMFDGKMLSGTIIESINDSNFVVSFAIPTDGESYTMTINRHNLTKIV